MSSEDRHKRLSWWPIYIAITANFVFMGYSLCYVAWPLGLICAALNGVAVAYSISCFVRARRTWRRLARRSVLRQLADGDKYKEELLEGDFGALREVGSIYIFLAQLEEEGVIEGYNGEHIYGDLHRRRYRITDDGRVERLLTLVKDFGPDAIDARA